MPGIRKLNGGPSREEFEVSSQAAGTSGVRRADGAREQTDALDDVLDDIASTLESNAEEYVNGFVQQGGE